MQREFYPMNAAEVLDKVIDVYKKSFGKQVAFAAVLSVVAFVGIFVVSIVLTIVLAILFSSLFIAAGAGGGFLAVGGVSIVFLLGMAVVFLPLILLWWAFSGSGHVLLSRQAFYGHRVKIRGMGIGKVVGRVFSALLAQAILFIPFILLVFGVIALFIFILGNVSPTGGGILFFSVLSLITMLLLGVGFFVYSNIFALSVAVAVFEKRVFFGIIKRSFQLVKTDFWRILGIRLVWYFVSMAFSMSMQGGIFLANALFAWLGGTMGMGVFAFMGAGMMFGVLAPGVAAILVMPLDGIMQAVIYFNQRMKNEGLDIEIRLEKLSLEKRKTP